MKKIIVVLVLVFYSVVVQAHEHSSDSYNDPVIKTQKYSFTYTEAMKSTMMMLTELNHSLSASQQSELAENVAAMDSSVNGVALAETMAVVQSLAHFPSDADKAKLAKLIDSVKDNAGDPNLISLMEIVTRVEHKVSAEDGAALKAMIASY